MTAAKNILLTGATGGIGRAVAERLARGGHRLVICGRDPDRLRATARSLEESGAEVTAHPCDLGDTVSTTLLVRLAEERLGGIDVLVNLAGNQCFDAFASQSTDQVINQLRVNLEAPVVMTHAVLPGMLSRGDGRIVNVGSAFGAIGFAYFSVYSAAKFGLRGFSEALRRELHGSGVSVGYVAPRATRTDMNSDAVYAMTEATGTRVDAIDPVADAIVAAVHNRRASRHIGYPEKLVARVNGAFPGLVDLALRRQNATARRFVPGNK